MKLIQLTFKKVGNHWYLDIPHDNPFDLKMERRIEFLIQRLDTWNEGVVNNVYLIEQGDVIVEDGIIQFTEEDLTRYFTTTDDFLMKVYISNHRFLFSSKLYQLLETQYHLDFHSSVYRISVI